MNDPKPIGNKKIAVAGDIMLDRYFYGDSSRLSPESPVPVVSNTNEINLPGGAANVATNLATLGAEVILFGFIGDDNNGKEFLNSIKGKKISPEVITIDNYKTTVKTRVLARNQQLIRIDEEEQISKEKATLLLERIKDNIDLFEIIIISDYDKGSLNEITEIINFLNKNNKIILIDPKGKDLKRYSNAYLIKPNINEFNKLIHKNKGSYNLETEAYKVIKRFNLHALLITKGKDGMILINKNNDIYELPSQAKEVFDVTGAGDTVIAAVAACLSKGKSIRDSVEFANHAAGLVVGKVGTSSISLFEVEKYINKNFRSNSRILKEDLIESIVNKYADQKKTIVFTNGVFDILHNGHTKYLEEASKLGDILIVGVNSDESVRKLSKGSGRPINKLESRLEILSSLRSVDWVVSFNEKTPEKLIKLISPNILVKGSDYQKNEIVGSSYVKSYGGVVKTIKILEGYSTTKIIEKIQKNKIN